MPLILHPRIRALAEQALATANNDPARAIRFLHDSSGLSWEMAFEAIDYIIDECTGETAE
jgi:hypothetical protein